MLSAIGRDCVGALQFLREGDARGEPGIITGDAVSDEDIAAILNNLKTAPLGMDDDADFRISLARQGTHVRLCEFLNARLETGSGARRPEQAMATALGWRIHHSHRIDPRAIGRYLLI
jgi:hypothetical protein